ncbi:MAG: NUDIX domain-containing protein [bacterium]
MAPETPVLAVDAIIQSGDKIALVKRKNPPHGWALPGGLVEIGETVEEAVVREIEEETGLELVNFSQWHVFSEPDRDPRQHTVSVCFVGEGDGELQAGTDAGQVEFFTLEMDKLPPLAFDHKKIISKFRNGN